MDPWHFLSPNGLRLVARTEQFAAWAGLIAHEFMHTLFVLDFDPGHGPGDWIYAIQDAISNALGLSGGSHMSCGYVP